jgi:hypothetical protein
MEAEKKGGIQGGRSWCEFATRTLTLLINYYTKSISKIPFSPA